MADDELTAAWDALRIASPSPAWHEPYLIVHDEKGLLEAFEVSDLVVLSIVLDRSGRYEREVFLEPDGVETDNDAVVILVGQYGSTLQYPFSIEEFDKEIKEHIERVTDEYETDEDD